MGAGRGRLIRQLLTETTILFIAGGVAGLLLSLWLTKLLLALIPKLPMPVEMAVHTDWRVVSFGIVLSFFAAILSGLAPALQASRPDLVPSLKDEVSATWGRRRFTLRNLLVVAQVGLSLVLLIGAGLFLRSLNNAQRINPGFDAERILNAQLNIEY